MHMSQSGYLSSSDFVTTTQPSRPLPVTSDTQNRVQPSMPFLAFPHSGSMPINHYLPPPPIIQMPLPPPPPPYRYLPYILPADELAQQGPPKKKRRRQALSCTECRRRKIKCDRNHTRLVRAEETSWRDQYEQLQKKLRHLEEIIHRPEQETKRREEEGIMRGQKEFEEVARTARSDPQTFGDTTARTSGLTTQNSIASVDDSMAKTPTFDFMGELLHLLEYSVPASELSTSNIESLLDFILHALCNDKLSSLRIQNANQKARKVMFELVSKTNIIPKSLFVTDVTTAKTMIGRGGFGHVFKGVYKGLPVALKVVDRGHTNDSLIKDFCREALAWRSLSHHFILPLIGIFEEESQFFLVSPFMANGTLAEWRKKGSNKIGEIHRLMLEVAEGVKYLHSEGIIHGDLHGRNVLLNSEFHCQITDFGSTRHFEATVTRSTTAFAMNFVAPELFGMCTKCGLFDCDGCQGNEVAQKRRKTMETDVYAYGCVYYATFFDSVPFHGKTDIQIVRLVTNGKRPDRLESPRMEDDTWDLIQRCWESIPSTRWTIEDIATALASPA